MPPAPDYAPSLAASGRRRPPRRATSPLKTRVGVFCRRPPGRHRSHHSQVAYLASGCPACGYKTASGRGKWLNADPAGLAEGPNLYAYVGNKPIDAVDPLGLAGLTTAQQLAQAQRILAQNNAIIQRTSGGSLSNSDIASIGGGIAGLGISAANAYHFAQPVSTDLRYYGMTMARSDVTAQALDVVGNGLAVTGATIDGYALGNSIVNRDVNGIETSSANIATDLTAAALGGPAGIILGGGQLAISIYVARDQAQFDAYNREADLQKAIYLSQLAQAAIIRLQKQAANCP